MPRQAAQCAACFRLRVFYTVPNRFDLLFMRGHLRLQRPKSVQLENIKMDVLYVGGLVLFTALTFALIAGCDKLYTSRRGQGERS
jgi:hypothetical protein